MISGEQGENDRMDSSRQLSLAALRENGYRGSMQGPSQVSSYPGLARYLHGVERAQNSETGVKKNQ